MEWGPDKTAIFSQSVFFLFFLDVISRYRTALPILDKKLKKKKREGEKESFHSLLSGVAVSFLYNKISTLVSASLCPCFAFHKLSIHSILSSTLRHYTSIFMTRSKLT